MVCILLPGERYYRGVRFFFKAPPYPAFNNKELEELFPKPKKPVGRKGLKRKSHRICIGKSEDLERKARFFAKQKMRTLVLEKPQK
jgi:hypothetical protein